MSETQAYEKPGPVEAELSAAISPTEEIIAEARAGRMFILVDHEDRENEGDLVIAAEFATPEAINFMATHGKGLNKSITLIIIFKLNEIFLSLV